jgi:hypothetical protein
VSNGKDWLAGVDQRSSIAPTSVSGMAPTIVRIDRTPLSRPHLHPDIVERAGVPWAATPSAISKSRIERGPRA